jgi:hypothetical protein
MRGVLRGDRSGSRAGCRNPALDGTEKVWVRGVDQPRGMVESTAHNDAAIV